MLEAHTFLRKVILEFYFSYTDDMPDKQYDLKTEQLEAYSSKTEIQLLLNAAFLPETIVDSVDKYVDKIFGSDTLYPIDENEYNVAIEVLEEAYEYMLDTAELMRYDIGIDVLHTKLRDRINPDEEKEDD
jgi:hypothetical protein